VRLKSRNKKIDTNQTIQAVSVELDGMEKTNAKVEKQKKSLKNISFAAFVSSRFL